MGKDEITLISVIGVIGVAFAVIAFIVKSIVAKWIWGILAVLAIAFAIFLLVDAIVKQRRRPKDLSELFAKAMKETASKPDFAQRMQEMANKRDLLFDGQRTRDSDYGYSPSNPIMTSTINDSDSYLNRLRTLDGKPFTWNRNGSQFMPQVNGVDEVMVDVYQLYLDGNEYKTIYICPYGHSSSYAPQDMKLMEE